MELAILIQIFVEAVCIPFYANALGKDINPSFLLHPTMSKLLPWLDQQPRRRKTEYKPLKRLTLCHLLLVTEQKCLFLSLMVFGLLSSSLLLFPRFS